MKREINPEQTNRAMAFNLWMKSPMPMVTITTTFNVTRLVRLGKKRKLSFNALLCYAIAKAASQVSEFFLLPEGGKLMEYDSLSVNVIVKTAGGINFCDIPYDGDFHRFLQNYADITRRAMNQEEVVCEERMAIGTSAMPECEIDSVTNQYCAEWNNPMLFWGRYRKGIFRTSLPMSFQFHHVQMDGGSACRFLRLLQTEINAISSQF